MRTELSTGVVNSISLIPQSVQKVYIFRWGRNSYYTSMRCTYLWQFLSG